MSNQSNKQVYNFSSPKSSSKSSPKRTFAEVVSPVSTPTRKIAVVSAASKRKRNEKFQGSSKGISKFRKISNPSSTLHRKQFIEANKEISEAAETVEVVVEKVIECNTVVNGEVITTKVKSSSSSLSAVRDDPSYRPIKVESANDKLYTKMYKLFEKRSWEDHLASQKIINSLTQALNLVFDNCSKSLNNATQVRDTMKKSSAPELGEMHKLCLMHKFESEVQSRKQAFLADTMFSNMSVINKVLIDNKISRPESVSSESSSATGRRVKFDKIDYYEPQSSNKFLKVKPSKTNSIIPKQTKPDIINASSESITNIEIELNTPFDNKTSFVDSAKKSQEQTRMLESWNEFKADEKSLDLENFEVSESEIVDTSEPDFTNSQLTEEAYEEVITKLTEAAMKDPKKYFNKKSFNFKP